MIRVSHLCKQYGAVTALADVSLNFRPGTITALAGPNGSGKTTLVKSILGMVKVNSGSIEFRGANLNGHHDYRRFIGYMPQDAQFPGNLRVREVIDLVQSVRTGAKEIDRGLLDRLRVDREMDKRVRTLSGGTRQRLSAAIAFMFRPELLILDEPTAGLDPVSSRILKDEILGYRQDGKTVIISSHVLNDLEEIAEEIVFLYEGKAMFSGPRDCLNEYTGEDDLERSFVSLMNGGDK